MNSDTATKPGLRLYQDGDGTIWLGTDGSKQPISCGSDPQKLLARQEVKSAHSIFLLGFRFNANLICELGLANLAAAVPPCYVGTPAVCHSAASPGEVLRSMSSLGNMAHGGGCLAGSLGGWHRVGPNDIAQYDLIRKFRASNGAFTGDVAEALQNHPAFPAVSFVPSSEFSHCAELLALIVDPRWYVDRAHPDRRSRLRRFLGLRESNIRTLQMVQPPKSRRGRYFHRAKTVLLSWSGYRDGLSNIDDPANFLMRCLRDEPGQVKAMQRTCNLFVSFVHDVWVDAVANIPGQYFVPKYFFRSQEESEAYKKHATSLNAT